MYLLGIFGEIRNPYDSTGFNVPGYTGTQGQGLIIIISNLFKMSIVIAGVYVLFNFILAGYGYMSANGDPKQIQKSVERIWRSVIGLAIVAGSILLGAIVGRLIFGPDNWNILISPVIFSP